ncbi:MAG: DUF1868 domain-containing protein [Clostridia bacterium]
MNDGKQIGAKFNADGTPRNYPGNTILADVTPGQRSYATMLYLRQALLSAGLAPLFILLPEDSFHMTVIRGMNDQVRTEAFWPPSLAKDAPMEQVDDALEKAFLAVAAPEKLTMRFSHVQINEEDFRVCLEPEDEQQWRKLRAYRDAIADHLGLRLAGHDAYTFHITQAYTWHLPSQAQSDALSAYAHSMNLYLAAQPAFMIGTPYAAFYRDMVQFYPHRIQR